MTASPFQEDEQPTTRSIVAWHGEPSNIPSGWVICDGNNGSPDMRNRFSKGTPNYSNTPGSVSGQHNISLSSNQIPSHLHTVSTGSNGSHSHGFAEENNYGGGSDFSGITQEVYNPADGTFASETGGSHSHPMTVDNAGSGNSIDNKPEYYELVFIYRL